jgi:hypothetical protein
MKGGNISLYLNFYDSHNVLIGGEHIKNAQVKKEEYSWSEITEKAPGNTAFCTGWIYSPKASTTDLLVRDVRFEEMNNYSSRILGDFDFREFVPQKFTLNADSNLFIKREDSVAVIRILAAYDVADKKISFELNNDGLDYGALRLTATHSSTKTGARGSLAAWAYAEEKITDDKKFGAFRAKVLSLVGNADVKENILTAHIRGINGEMEIVADIRNETRISRKGMSGFSENGILSVNGVDIGKKILENIETIKRYSSQGKP